MAKEFITYLKKLKLYSLYRRSSKDRRNELYKFYMSCRLSTYGFFGIKAPI